MRTPWDGTWVGNGVIDPDWPGEFDPGVAGPGFHKLVYTANTCSDSMTMVVYPSSIPADTAVCEQAQPFALPTTAPGGVWSDPMGFVDPATGIFNAQNAGVGFHTVYYFTPRGCQDTSVIEVYSLPNLSIDNLDAQYCYKDTNYVLQAFPPGGTFTGPGITGNIFNPTQAGVGGPYFIEYTFGVGDCQANGIRHYKCKSRAGIIYTI